jgi:hypothetical protein
MNTLKNPYGFAFARNQNHARRLRNLHLKRPGVNAPKVMAAYNQAMQNLQTSLYTTKIFPRGAFLYRASSEKKYDRPSNIGFYAVDKKTRAGYRMSGRTRFINFTTTERLRLFVMNKTNLVKLIENHPTNRALLLAVANVTSVGLARGASFYRYHGKFERYSSLFKQYQSVKKMIGWIPTSFVKTHDIINSLSISPWALTALAVVVYSSGALNLKPTNDASVLHVATQGID